MGRLTHLLLFVLLVQAAAVEAADAVVRGRATDAAGLPLPGVTITITLVQDPHAAAGASSQRTATTDEHGAFLLQAPPGRYVVRAEIQGFDPLEQPLALDGRGASSLDLQLHVASYREQVTVRGEASQAVLGKPQPDAPVTVTREVVDSGMMPNSQYDDVLPLLPNVVRGPDGLISVAGASAPQGSLLVNGLNETDPIAGVPLMLLPLEAVESMDVFSGGYPADAGRATGGVTSVRTRAGGDEWHASANSFFPRLRFVAGRLYGIDSWDPNVGLLGPLVKGRVFLEQAISYRFDRNRFDTLAGSQDSIYSAFVSWSQLDVQASSGHHFVGFVSFDPQRTEHAGVTAFTTANSVPLLERGGWSASAGDRVVVSTSTVLALTAGVVRSRLGVSPDGASPYVVGHDQVQGSYFDRQDLRGTRIQVSASWNWTGWQGHELRAGADVSHAALDGTDAAGDVTMLRSDGQLSQRISFLPVPTLSGTAREAGAFAQFRWQARANLTVDAGTRLDWTTLARPVGSPRIAWTLKLPTGDTTLSGSVGLFGDKVPLEAYGFPLRQPREVLSALDGSDVVYRNVIDGPLRTPLATRWDLELDRRFVGGWQARVKYQERRGHDELIVNPIRDTATTGRLALSSSGASSSRSLEATLAYRAPGAGHELYLSYVRSRSEGDLNSLDTITGAFRQPLVLPNQVGPLLADVPHRLLAWGLVRLPLRITVAPFVEIRSGFAYSAIDDDWLYAGPANRARLPWFGSLDLYVNKVVTVSSRLPDARLGVKFYNLASIHTERDVQRNTAQPEFGQTYNPIPRDFTLVFELLWGRK
ncbi:MAG TPA: TonB-dependent receptor [Vicinamibacterales bacterium]|jgi:hypothetical protein